MVERPPFRHAVEALTYLFNPERTTCDRPPAARLADKRRSEPGIMSGLDGAATAASATAMIKGRLTPLQMAILTCRYAPVRLRCNCKSDCCSGWRTNPAWREAVSYVAFDAIYQATMGEGANHRFASAVLLREYGNQKIALTDLGADLGMSLGTCTNQRRRLLDWLLRPKGQSDKKNKNDSLARPALPMGKEPIAFAAAEEALRLGGFIE